MSHTGLLKISLRTGNGRCNVETAPGKWPRLGAVWIRCRDAVIIRMEVWETAKLLKSYLTFLLPWSYFFAWVVKLVSIMGSGVF